MNNGGASERHRHICTGPAHWTFYQKAKHLCRGTYEERRNQKRMQASYMATLVALLKRDDKSLVKKKKLVPRAFTLARSTILLRIITVTPLPP